jgi:hypothetical protein
LRKERVAKLLTGSQQVALALGGPDERRRFLSAQMQTWGAVAQENTIKRGAS